MQKRKALLSRPMNGRARSENDFAKTKENEDYIRLFLYRKKVYLSFKKLLIIMEAKMILQGVN